MQFEHTDKVKALIARLEAFFDEHIYPNEKAVAELVAQREGKARWEPIPLVEQLKPKARAAGLWNMFLPHSDERRGADEPRIRAAVRGDGPRRLVRRSVQLLRAGHRQHGDPRPLRVAGEQGALARSRCSTARSAPRSA